MTTNQYVPINPEYKPEESIDDIFFLKRNTLKRKIRLLKEQVKERRKNLEDNLKEIDNDLCGCKPDSRRVGPSVV